MKLYAIQLVELTDDGQRTNNVCNTVLPLEKLKDPELIDQLGRWCTELNKQPEASK